MKEEFDTAIVDYGLGNLFSVRNTCEHVGLKPIITNDEATILAAKLVILPGVGAFGDAISVLKERGLDKTLRTVADSDQMLFCICLGLQLLMTESFEFGRHQGLDIIQGQVLRLSDTDAKGNRVRVPHVGWSQVYYGESKSDAAPDHWLGSPLENIKNRESMYFVHSYFVKPVDPSVILTKTVCGDQEYCSSIRYKNIFACQFHPERSGQEGLKIYRYFADKIASSALKPAKSAVS